MNEYEVHSATELPGKKLLSEIYGLIFLNLPHGLVLLNQKGIIKFANDYFASLFEKSSDEITNKDFISLFSSNSQNDILSEFLKSFTLTEGKNSFEKKIITSSKKTIWIKYNQNIIHIEGEKHLLLYIEDITLQKNLLFEIQNNGNHYRDLFNNINDAIFLCHLNYGKTLSTFFDTNDEALKRLNLSREEISKQHPLYIIFHNDEANLVNVLEKLHEDGNCIFTTNIVSKDGTEFSSEINSHLFEYNNRPTVIFIARDLKERYGYESTLMKYGDKLRNLALHIQTIREEERTIISREIHDELGQVLTVLKIQVSLLANKLTPSQAELKNKFDSIIEMIDKSVESVQKICGKLRPGILDDLGISAAIEWQANEFTKRTGIDCVTDFPVEEIEIDPDKKTAVFRIFQEALTNIARHANASKVSVILNRDENFLHLLIKDNGKGITKNQIHNPKSLGILGMKERAQILGGIFEIKSTMRSGTLISLKLPIKHYSKI